MQQIPFIDLFKSALHVSGDKLVHPQDLVGCLYLSSNDARSHKHYIFCFQKLIFPLKNFRLLKFITLLILLYINSLCHNNASIFFCRHIYCYEILN